MPARPEHRPKLPFLSPPGWVCSSCSCQGASLPCGGLDVLAARRHLRHAALAWSTCREPAGSQAAGGTGRRIGDEPSVHYPRSSRRLKQHLHSLIARPGQFCPTPGSGSRLRPVPRVCWAAGGAACLPEEAPPGALGCPALPACRAWWVKPVLTLCPSGFRCPPAPVWPAMGCLRPGGPQPHSAAPHRLGTRQRCCEPSSNV